MFDEIFGDFERRFEPRSDEFLRELEYLRQLQRRFGGDLPNGRRRRRRPGGEPEFTPVEPRNPKGLTGGAEARLEFDD
jgi:hypothetical protein